MEFDSWFGVEAADAQARISRGEEPEAVFEGLQQRFEAKYGEDIDIAPRGTPSASSDYTSCGPRATRPASRRFSSRDPVQWKPCWPSGRRRRTSAPVPAPLGYRPARSTRGSRGRRSQRSWATDSALICPDRDDSGPHHRGGQAARVHGPQPVGQSHGAGEAHRGLGHWERGPLLCDHMHPPLNSAVFATEKHAINVVHQLSSR